MKFFISIAIFLIGCLSFGQVHPYYSSIDFSQSGNIVKLQLTSLITNTHNPITYDDCWNVLKTADLDPGSQTTVLLVYGYNDGDGNPVTDRTRGKDLNGGNNGNWNREHIFPKSLGNPDLGTTGPGSDAHNLKPADVQQNNNRANKKFTESTGNAASLNGNWYPGDEWKGDCARIIMYMYLRYGTRCLPSAVGTGSYNSTDPYMMNMFLEWNVDDPVSQHEQNRNNAIYNAQGNRNPFIDNPSIATKIWGGPPAEDPWGGLNTDQNEWSELRIYPMPISGDAFQLSGINTLKIREMELFDISGRLVGEIDLTELDNNGGISVEHFNPGTYVLSIIFDEATIRKKIIIE